MVIGPYSPQTRKQMDMLQTKINIQIRDKYDRQNNNSKRKQTHRPTKIETDKRQGKDKETDRQREMCRERDREKQRERLREGPWPLLNDRGELAKQNETLSIQGSSSSNGTRNRNSNSNNNKTMSTCF